MNDNSTEVSRLYEKFSDSFRADDDEAVRRIYRQLLRLGRPRAEIVEEAVRLASSSGGLDNLATGQRVAKWTAAEAPAGMDPTKQMRTADAFFPDIRKENSVPQLALSIDFDPSKNTILPKLGMRIRYFCRDYATRPFQPDHDSGKGSKDLPAPVRDRTGSLHIQWCRRRVSRYARAFAQSFHFRKDSAVGHSYRASYGIIEQPSDSVGLTNNRIAGKRKKPTRTTRSAGERSEPHDRSSRS